MLPMMYDAAAEFATAMARLEPFEPAPRLAVAVSGGADSMALALLARDWVRSRGGALLALVVDHGLRPESAAEAATTIQRLGTQGIPARLLRLADLLPGAALAERARTARYQALIEACAADGRLHLLLGHHALDQAETVLIRRAGGSGPRGLAAMPALVELPQLRLLRPMLRVPPARLRDLLRQAGIDWVEDPSNRDLRALRSRVRIALADPDGTADTTASLCQAARQAGQARADQDVAIATALAGCVGLYPEGFAHLACDTLPQAVLAALIQMVSGADYPPGTASTACLAGSMRAATLAGVRALPAGRRGSGWLLVREARAVAPPVPARPGAVWDGRFRLAATALPPRDARIGALAADAARLRRLSPLPAAVLQTLPAIRCGNLLVGVPHLHYPDRSTCARLAVGFSPGRPAAGAWFLPA